MQYYYKYLKGEDMKKFLTSQQVAEYLGISLSKLYKLTMKKKIPHVKLFGRLRFNIAEVNEWLDEISVRVLTEDEILAIAENLAQ